MSGRRFADAARCRRTVNVGLWVGDWAAGGNAAGVWHIGVSWMGWMFGGEIEERGVGIAPGAAVWATGPAFSCVARPLGNHGRAVVLF